MSIQNVERFVSDLKANVNLQAEIKNKDGDGMSAIVAVAKAHGYEISTDDVNAYVRSQRSDLPEEELKRISGGFLGSKIAIIAILIGL